MNAMAAAFQDAGYREPYERAVSIAVDAWAKWPNADAGGARRDFISQYFKAEPGWSVMLQFQPSSAPVLIGQLLAEARVRIVASRPQRDAGHKPANDGGHVVVGTQKENAPVIPPFTDAGRKPADGGGQYCFDTQESIAPAVPSFRDAAPPQGERRSEPAKLASIPMGKSPAAPPKHPAASIAANLAVAARLSKLDTFSVNGRPIGDCTPDEIRPWLRSRGRDMRFAEMLIANLPASRPVREFIRADEADAIYQRAEATNAA